MREERTYPQIMRVNEGTYQEIEDQFIAEMMLNITKAIRENPNLPGGRSRVYFLDAILSAKRNFRAYQEKAVCDMIENPVFPTDSRPHSPISKTHVVVPNLGGIITELKMRGPGVHKITEAAARENKFVLTENHGEVVAMTVQEAYLLGLQECKEWVY